MPISLSAKKSLRKSLKNRKENALFKTKLKLAVKKFLDKPTTEGLKSVYSILDKSVKNGIFHRNKTARLKSNLSKKLKLSQENKKKTKVKNETTKKSKSTKKM